MNIDEHYKRRIRIEGDLKSPDSRGVNIYDIDTGEAITNILAITIHLDALRRVNEVDIMYDIKADVAYAVYDEHGKLVERNGDIIEKISTVDNPAIAVTALERISKNKGQQ